jgi:hypothetical protein
MTETGKEQRDKERRHRTKQRIVDRIWGIIAGRRRFDMLVSPFAEKV